MSLSLRKNYEGKFGADVIELSPEECDQVAGGCPPCGAVVFIGGRTLAGLIAKELGKRALVKAAQGAAIGGGAAGAKGFVDGVVDEVRDNRYHEINGN